MAEQWFDLREHEADARPVVAIIGMGYVGAVTAAALSGRGYGVIGVETNATKLDMLRRGESPVREPGLDIALRIAVEGGRLTATDDLAAAARRAQVIMVAVGTPSDATGSADLSAIDRVTEDLAAALAGDDLPRVVMIRSTVPPGTTRTHIAPRLHEAGGHVAVCHHPEFLREGSALADWSKPAMIAFGADGRDMPVVESAMRRMYDGVEAPWIAVGTAESEMLKYACNVFHAVKINFANEIGSLAGAVGADPAVVMRAFCEDRRLNISPAYLKPGFAFGGSCLPKDTRSLTGIGRSQGVRVPMLESVLESNRSHLERQVERVLACGRRPTLLVGLSFKQGTDDLRESPMVELAERLLGKGVPLTIHDPDLMPDQLLGANAKFIDERLPHLKLLLREDLRDAAADASVVVLAKKVEGLSAGWLAGRTVIDLTTLALNKQSESEGVPTNTETSVAARAA